MNKFKAFRIHSTAGKISSGFENIEIDDLSAGDVLIKAVYSSINYKDALAATGKGRILKSYPLVGGIDVSGYVEESADKRFNKGDKVLICGAGLSETRDGGYAEFVRVPANIVIPLPTQLSLFESMAIGTAGFTAAMAVHQLQHNGQTPDMGPTVVTGATGGVGSFAIDLLSALGFEVIAISGKKQKADYLKSLGASKILFRDQLDMGNKPLEPGLWGGAVDTVGGQMLSWLTRTVNPLGNIATIGLTGGINLETTVMPFILRGINLLGINSVYCPDELKSLIWNRLASDLKPRHIKEIVTDEIVLDQLAEKFEAYLQGNVCGRVVVKIQ